MPRAILPFKASPFAFPSRSPRFDPSHVASRNIHYAGVANRASFINLLNGAAPLLTVGGFTLPIDGVLGSSVGYGSTTGTANHFYVQGPIGTPTQATIGALARFSNLSNYNGILGDSDGGTEVVSLFVDVSSVLMMRIGSTNILSSLTMTAGVPYFAAASVNQSTVVNFVLARLDTGQIQTQTVSTGGLTMTASNGNYAIGNRAPQVDFGMTGNLAAVMYNYQFMSIPQLLQWAQDPWAFWYARTLDLADMLSAGSGVLPPLVFVPNGRTDRLRQQPILDFAPALPFTPGSPPVLVPILAPAWHSPLARGRDDPATRPLALTIPVATAPVYNAPTYLNILTAGRSEPPAMGWPPLLTTILAPIVFNAAALHTSYAQGRSLPPAMSPLYLTSPFPPFLAPAWHNPLVPGRDMPPTRPLALTIPVATAPVYNPSAYLNPLAQGQSFPPAIGWPQLQIAILAPIVFNPTVWHTPYAIGRSEPPSPGWWRTQFALANPAILTNAHVNNPFAVGRSEPPAYPLFLPLQLSSRVLNASALHSPLPPGQTLPLAWPSSVLIPPTPYTMGWLAHWDQPNYGFYSNIISVPSFIPPLAPVTPPIPPIPGVSAYKVIALDAAYGSTDVLRFYTNPVHTNVHPGDNAAIILDGGTTLNPNFPVVFTLTKPDGTVLILTNPNAYIGTINCFTARGIFESMTYAVCSLTVDQPGIWTCTLTNGVFTSTIQRFYIPARERL